MYISNSTSLKAAIYQLEQKQIKQKEMLVAQFHETYESLRPLNVIKSEFNRITGSSETKNNVVNAAIGLGAGFLSKKIFLGGSHNIIKRLFGTVIEVGIAKLVAGNADKIREKGLELKEKGVELLHTSKNGHIL
ncbi:MAG TPA: hypothetical protein VK705_09625 [Ferruginibacter sp.]|jgi:hypothetical protein|nr:hypothetical protein [Ferruginibacter sp.]